MATQTLPIDQLQTNPFQPREKVKKSELEELAKSIKTYGVLEPLVVAETPAGYQIIAGERRWQAAQLAGLKEVPVHVRKTTPQGMLEMALVENVQRQQLNPIERAQAFVRLTREFSLSSTDLSERIGKSPAYISNTTKLLELPDAITDGLIDGKITEELPYDIDTPIDPVYKEIPSWSEDLTGITRKEELPAELLDYVAFIEQEVGVPVSYVSVGPDREQIIKM
jgi:ParB/RepB/Spo0J family partition protein